MALIHCKNCNHEISDTLKKCIHCGAKVEKETTIKEEVPQQKIQPPKITKEIVKETPTKAKNVEVKKIKKEKIVKEKPPKQKKEKPHNGKLVIIVISLLSILVLGLGTFLICDKLIFDNRSLENDNKTNNDNQNGNYDKINAKLVFNNLRSIIAPIVSYEELISKNGDISVIIEIENGKSVKYAFDITNDSNDNIYYDFTDINNMPTITCNSDMSYTCVSNINVGWEDNQESNLIKPHTTRTYTFEITTTGAEENGIIKIKTHKENTNNNKVDIDNVVLLVTEDCIHCQKFQVVVNNFVDKYNLPLNTVDYEIKDSRNENGEIVYPTLLLYKNNTLVLRHEGYVSENELIQIIKNKGLIKE